MSAYRPFDPYDVKFRLLYHRMPYCAVLGCCNDTRDGNVNSSVSFHSFPINTHVRQKWILATGRQYWKPRSSAKICSAHFKSNQFHIRQDGKRCMKNGALPTLKVFAYETEELSSDGDDEPSTSTDCQTYTEEFGQNNDDDDIICIESALANKKKLNNTLDATASKETYNKTLQSKNVMQKIEIKNDEFQMFANNIAAQLRTLPLDIALNLQTEIHRLVAKKRTELYTMSKKEDFDELPNVENNE